MRKTDIVRLQHMIDSGKKAISFALNRQRVDLDQDEMLTLALVRLLEILGEAGKNVSEATKAKSPNIPWRLICGTCDRLDVIVSLPAQPLIHYSTPLNRNKVRQIATNLQKTLFEAPIQTGRITNNYQEDAQTLYQALIQPVEQKLESNQIKNLTFVLDGILRNIPMAILSDGEKFLLKKYSIALTPVLQP